MNNVNNFRLICQEYSVILSADKEKVSEGERRIYLDMLNAVQLITMRFEFPQNLPLNKKENFINFWPVKHDLGSLIFHWLFSIELQPFHRAKIEEITASIIS